MSARATASSAPIGVFDSGVGGLTVLERLRHALPAEDFIYLGDTARVPYGTKSPETVARYAENVARLLIDRGCKALVIACNTASAFGLDAVRAIFHGPVVDVIEPVAAGVALTSTTGRIGVLGTRGTVASGAYVRALQAGGRDLHVVQRACPLFVPLAEEGWTEGEVPLRVVETYLGEFIEREHLDSLILGCTHYPLLRPVIEEVVARRSSCRVTVHESGGFAAERLVLALEHAGLARSSGTGRATYLVSDDPDGFCAVGRRFLGEDVPVAEHVHVG